MDPTALNLENRRRIAAFLKYAPWTGQVAQALWRTWRPWVTVGVVGTIFNGAGQMLIVEHVFHPKFPWGLPGGWMERDESPDDTVRREALEETNLRIEVIKPLLIAKTAMLAGHLDIAYLCTTQQNPDEVQLSSELLAYKWIEPQEAPPMGVFHGRVIRAAMAERSMGEF
jgi:8-oxo-dGTP pyrophosphatase MutT (NUDIX family)